MNWQSFSEVKEFLKKQILNFFKEKDADIFLFGSRAHADSVKKFSDYDIGFFTEEILSNLEISNLREQLEAFPIAQKIDLVDFSKVDENFKAYALKEVQIWKKKKNNSLFD
ncbi:MAG: nucleotidyltransferase domain-containing protein [Deltaproteobacteria bacterium]|nr:nucleotidyltransferase domain-containing protein [Deltaproteobacteria bacterium]